MIKKVNIKKVKFKLSFLHNSKNKIIRIYEMAPTKQQQRLSRLYEEQEEIQRDKKPKSKKTLLDQTND